MTHFFFLLFILGFHFTLKGSSHHHLLSSSSSSCWRCSSSSHDHPVWWSFWTKKKKKLIKGRKKREWLDFRKKSVCILFWTHFLLDYSSSFSYFRERKRERETVKSQRREIIVQRKADIISSLQHFEAEQLLFLSVKQLSILFSSKQDFFLTFSSLTSSSLTFSSTFGEKESKCVKRDKFKKNCPHLTSYHFS